MLRRLLGRHDDADRGVAFLEGLLPSDPWVLAAIGRNTAVATFLPPHGSARPWIAQQLASGHGVRLMLGSPYHAMTVVPIKADIRWAVAAGIEVAPAHKSAVEGFNRPPSIWVRGPQSLFAVWRFMSPVHPDIAAKAEAVLAARFGGKPLAFFMPLPNAGGFSLDQFEKGRFVVPTDFQVAAETPKPKRKEPASLADVESKPVDWLWPQVFALGKLALLGGLPGVGKSQIALSLASAVTTGGMLPDGSLAPRGRALIFASEDDAADTIKPRLQALGADVARVHIVEEHVSLSEELEKFQAICDAIPSLALIVFDPISRYLEGQNAKVRRALTETIAWSAKKRIALVGLQHPPKGESANVQNLFGGAASFMQLTRAAWMAMPYGDSMAMLYAKGNIIRDRRGYAYRIESVELPGGIETSRVVWDAERIAITADEYLAGAKAGAARVSALSSPDPVRRARSMSAVPNAAEWLRAALESGPRVATELKAEARDAGISIGTLYAAARYLGVDIEDVRSVNESKTWSLASGDAT